MEYVVWDRRPTLRRPVLVAAFEGWNDAGDAASLAGRYLRDLWDATPIASIEAEEFYDFSTTRPRVRLADGVNREIVWPSTEVTVAALPDGDRDIVFVLGSEPQLRWRTYCEQLVHVATELKVEMVVTMGALLADVSHTRPVRVMGTAADAGLSERFSFQPSRYEGPTGIVGVLQETFRRAGLKGVSLWATVPAYMPAVPSPKAALALVERAGELLDAPVPTTGLEIAAASYEREMDAAVQSDEDLAAYLSRLEELDDEDEDDDDEDDEEPTPEPTGNLVEEVERFLRDQRGE